MVVVTVIMIMVIFPLYWLASNSIKTATEYLKTPPVIVPTKVTLDNYIEIFTKSKAGRSLYNTVMVNLPMSIWLMIGFFQDVPDGIEQSGKIDGCNMFQRFFYLVLPISKPGIVASAILVFNAAWNEFLFSAILSINKSKTLSVVISGFITDKGLEWGPMAALSMVLIVPVVVLV